MALASKYNNANRTSWLVSFILHGIIIAVLLITTSKTLTSSNNDKPPARIASVTQENIKLENEIESEIVDIPYSAAVPMPDFPEASFDQFQASIAPVVVPATAVKTTLPSVVKSNTTPKSIFFGTSGQGDKICYVVDISGSMVMAIDYIKAELIRSISKLGPNQYFQIIFYASDIPICFAEGSLTRASYYNRKNAIEFINKISVQAVPSNMESWRPILKALRDGFDSQTFDQKSANMIYLFTDGDFEYTIIDQAVKGIQKRRKTPATVNIILCGTMENERYLIELAKTYRGQYLFLTDDQLVNPKLITR